VGFRWSWRSTAPRSLADSSLICCKPTKGRHSCQEVARPGTCGRATSCRVMPPPSGLRVGHADPGRRALVQRLAGQAHLAVVVRQVHDLTSTRTSAAHFAIAGLHFEGARRVARHRLGHRAQGLPPRRRRRARDPPAPSRLIAEPPPRPADQGRYRLRHGRGRRGRVGGCR
jgi:hypothetical protein